MIFPDWKTCKCQVTMILIMKLQITCIPMANISHYVGRGLFEHGRMIYLLRTTSTGDALVYGYSDIPRWEHHCLSRPSWRIFQPTTLTKPSRWRRGRTWKAKG